MSDNELRNRIAEILSGILSDRYKADVTVTFEKKPADERAAQ